MEQAQTPQAASVSSANAKSIWSIVAYLSWVGALVTAFKKRDAFHLWHAKVSVGVSVLYFLVYAVVRVLVQVMPTAGFIGLLALLVNLFGFAMFVLTIVAVLKAWKGEQWSFLGLAKISQKVPLEKLFSADGSTPAVAQKLEAVVEEAVAPSVVAPEVTPAPVEVAPTVEAVPAPAPTPVETPVVAPMPAAEPTVVAPVPTPVVEEMPVVEPQAVEVEVQQAPEAPAPEPTISIEPAVPVVPAAPEAAVEPEAPVQVENPMPPTA